VFLLTYKKQENSKNKSYKLIYDLVYVGTRIRPHRRKNMKGNGGFERHHRNKEQVSQ